MNGSVPSSVVLCRRVAPDDVRDVLPLFEATLRDRPAEVGAGVVLGRDRAVRARVSRQAEGFKGPAGHKRGRRSGYGTLSAVPAGALRPRRSCPYRSRLECPLVRRVEAECPRQRGVRWRAAAVAVRVRPVPALRLARSGRRAT